MSYVLSTIATLVVDKGEMHFGIPSCAKSRQVMSDTDLKNGWTNYTQTWGMSQVYTDVNMGIYAY